MAEPTIRVGPEDPRYHGASEGQPAKKSEPVLPPEMQPETESWRTKMFQSMEYGLRDPRILEGLNGMEFTMKGKPYKILEFVKKGGMGAVFRVQTPDGGTAILKLSQPMNRKDMYLNEFPTQKEEKKADDVRALIRETAILKKMTGKSEEQPFPEYIDALFLADPTDKNVRLMMTVMEEIKGGSLSEEIRKRTNFASDPEDAVRLAAEIAGAIQLMHDAKFVHSDIKPGNILLDEHGHAKVTDFGLGVFLDDSGQPLTETDPDNIGAWKRFVPEHKFGTPQYMPPLRNYEATSKARDVFSLGRTIQHILLGADYKNVIGIDLTLEDRMPAELQELGKLSVEMTDPVPENRPTMPEVITRLQEMQAEISARKVGNVAK